MEGILILILLACFPLLLVAFVSFDRLVQHEYTHFRRDWEKDGRPVGFFWQAYDVPWHKRRAHTMVTWLFRAPEWAKSNDQAAALVTRMRTYVVIWNVVGFTMLGAMIRMSIGQ